MLRLRNEDKLMRSDLKLALMALCQPVLVIFQGLLNIYGVTSIEQSTTVRAILSAIPVLVALPVIFKRRPTLFKSSFLFIGLFVAFQWVAFPANRELISLNSWRFIFPILIPSFLAISCMYRPVEALYKGLAIISWVIALEAAFFIWAMYSTGRLGVDYDMGMGFSLLVAAIYFITRQNIYCYLITLFLTAIILVACSRSPLLALAIFAGYYFFIEKRKSKVALFVIPLLVLLVIFIKPILSSIQSYGIESRTIVMFLSDDINNASGRDNIYPVMEKCIEENPLFGIGIYGDRTLYRSDDVSTSYAHNLFLEIWVDYGVFFGSLFILAIFVVPVFLIWKVRQDCRIVFMVIAIGCLIPLFFSGSYLVSPLFATYLGFCYYIIKNRKFLGSNVKRN